MTDTYAGGLLGGSNGNSRSQNFVGRHSGCSKTCRRPGHCGRKDEPPYRQKWNARKEQNEPWSGGNMRDGRHGSSLWIVAVTRSDGRPKDIVMCSFRFWRHWIVSFWAQEAEFSCTLCWLFEQNEHNDIFWPSDLVTATIHKEEPCLPSLMFPPGHGSFCSFLAFHFCR